MCAISSVDSGLLSTEIIPMMQKALEVAEKAKEKDLVVFVGNTGVGKSTTINYLADCIMMRDEHGQIVAEDPIAKIGTNPVLSETMLSSCYPFQNHGYFVDTGGFLDTRSIEEQVIAPFSAKWTMANGKTAKVVLCADMSLLGIDRNVSLTELFKMVMEGLVKGEFEKYLSTSFLLLFTKAKAEPIGEFDKDGQEIYELPTIETLTGRLNKYRESYPEDSVERRIYDFILREGGRYLDIVEPLDKGASRERILAKLSGMGVVDKPESCFKGIPHSPSTWHQIKATMDKIGSMGITLYDAYHDKLNEIKEINAESIAFAEKMCSFENTLKQLVEHVKGVQSEAHGYSDPEKAKKTIEEILVKIGRNIEEKNASIAQHQNQVEDQKKFKFTRMGMRDEISKNAPWPNINLPVFIALSLHPAFRLLDRHPFTRPPQVQHGNSPETITRLAEIQKEIEKAEGEIKLMEQAIEVERKEIEHLRLMQDLANQEEVRMEEMVKLVPCERLKEEKKQKIKDELDEICRKIRKHQEEFRFLDDYIRVTKDNEIEQSSFVVRLTSDKRKFLIQEEMWQQQLVGV